MAAKLKAKHAKAKTAKKKAKKAHEKPSAAQVAAAKERIKAKLPEMQQEKAEVERLRQQYGQARRKERKDALSAKLKEREAALKATTQEVREADAVVREVEGGTPPPDGFYDVLVEGVELKDTNNGGKAVLWSLEIIGPTRIGRKLYKYDVVKKGGSQWLHKNLLLCGVTMTTYENLPETLKKVPVGALKLQVRKAAGVVFFNQRID